MGERGATFTEYALVLGLVVLGVLGSLRLLGVRLDEMWAAIVAGWGAITP